MLLAASHDKPLSRHQVALPSCPAPLRSLLGGTAGALLVLIIPGLVAAAGGCSGGCTAMQRTAGALLALAGALLIAATLLRVALFPAPS